MEFGVTERNVTQHQPCPFVLVIIHSTLCEPVFSLQQASYDDIKKVVKAAAEGPMKGILGYTEHQVCVCLLSNL